MWLIRDICRDVLIKTRVYSSRLILGYLRALGVVGGNCLSRLVSTGWTSEDKGNVLLKLEKWKRLKNVREDKRRLKASRGIRNFLLFLYECYDLLLYDRICKRREQNAESQKR